MQVKEGLPPLLQKLFKPPATAAFVAREASLCGHHVSAQRGYLAAYGDRMEHVIEPHPGDGTFPFCRVCISKAAIACSWCGKPIFPGTPVTLYEASIEERFSFGFLDRATVFSDEPFRVVGCGRRQCAHEARHYAGLWVMRQTQHPQFGWCGIIQKFRDAEETAYVKHFDESVAEDFFDCGERVLADELIAPESMRP